MSTIVKLLLIISITVGLSGAVMHRPLHQFFKKDAGLPTHEEYRQYFKEWHLKHGGAEVQATSDREAVFINRVSEIIRHNQNPKRTFNRTVNRFTGRYLSEMIGATLMKPQNCKITSDPIKPSTGSVGVPGFFFDWRDKSVVTPIRDQKNCASSYAFAAAAAVESHWGIRVGAPPVLTSEQQPIDCSLVSGNSGCDGGIPYKAFDYIQQVNGLSTENTYPFEAQDGTCRFSVQNVYAKVYNGSVNIYPGDELAVYQALNTFGPISIGMQVVDDFLEYDGGIYQSTDCQNTTQIINHAMTIVGYGTDTNSGIDYWVAKNSWGTTWGEEGYVRIMRGLNTCGISNCASYPNVNYTNPITNSSSGVFQDTDAAFMLSFMD